MTTRGWVCLGTPFPLGKLGVLCSERESSVDQQHLPSLSVETKCFKMQITGFWNNPGLSPGNVFIIHILLATGAPITLLLLSSPLANY